MVWKVPVALALWVGIVGSFVFGSWLPQLQHQEEISIVITQPSVSEYQSFPFLLDDLLVVESLGGYEGPYLEDGTYEEVCDILAVQVRNCGEIPIKNTEFTLKTTSKEYHFKGSFIQPGQSCVLLELGRAAYRGDFEATCFGTVTQDHRHNLLHTHFEIYEGSDDVLTITNKTTEAVGETILYYKTYFAQTDTLMGGVTNQMRLGKLEPGESQLLRLPYYASGYSTVVAIYTE